MHKLLVITILIAFSVQAPAQTNDQNAFARLKLMQGLWKGRESHGGVPHAASVVYKVQDSGKSVVETEKFDDGHELRITYHLQAGNLFAIIDQRSKYPGRLKYVHGIEEQQLRFDSLVPADKSSIEFELQSLRLNFIGPNHIAIDYARFSRSKTTVLGKFDLHRTLKR